MAEHFAQSWTSEEQLEELARYRRNNEIVRGVVQSVGTKKTRVLEDGKYVEKEMDVAVFLLEGGVTAYCPENEFSEYEFKSLNGFTGSIQEFIIDHLDIEGKMAAVSVKKADRIKRNRLFSQLEDMETKKSLKDATFKGTVSGYNPQTNRIFVRVGGADCFMMANDWNWGRVRDLASQIERGTTIEVKVLRFDKERELIQVSRRHAIEDPFKKLEQLKDMQTVAGKVTGVDPIHGIFVQLDVGLEVKGIKPRTLEEPVVGDIVSCSIRSIDRAKRHAKVVIVNYPRGKKQRKDVGAFLFE